MTEQMPKDVTVRLRQMAASLQEPGSKFPEWFIDIHNNYLKQGSKTPNPWITIISTAADELEQMQRLNGRLIKRLAGE